ncbi:MAG: aminopeptidase [Erysipelotrichaceae bacterium]
MPSQNRLRKYARLAVSVGANVQPGQMLVIQGATDTREFIRLCVEEAYEVGAKSVMVRWSDDPISHTTYLKSDVETLEEVPAWIVAQFEYFMEKGAALLSVASPTPGLLADVDPVKLQRANIATRKALTNWQAHMMGNKTQWSIVAVPTVAWAKKVFPALNDEEAVDALWNAILTAVRVREDNDPVQEWRDHNARLSAHNAALNDHNFKSLHFKNSLGTDLVVELVKNHIWAGGDEKNTQGVHFNPNMPTEETFTMPLKFGVNGKVVATKPLNYQGRLIDGFWLEFKDGKVVSYDAAKEKEALSNLLSVDEGSSYLGEVALISHDSPISNANILFLNTLFDENASCHLALGRAYPMNLKGGLSMSQEELAAAGSNHSMEHQDFMFGSADMSIVGITHDGKEVVVFKDGNFAF